MARIWDGVATEATDGLPLLRSPPIRAATVQRFVPRGHRCLGRTTDDEDGGSQPGAATCPAAFSRRSAGALPPFRRPGTSMRERCRYEGFFSPVRDRREFLAVAHLLRHEAS